MRRLRRLRVARQQPIVGGVIERGFEVEPLLVGFAKLVAEIVDRS